MNGSMIYSANVGGNLAYIEEESGSNSKKSLTSKKFGSQTCSAER
jgi:hypothetical protein